MFVPELSDVWPPPKEAVIAQYPLCHAAPLGQAVLKIVDSWSSPDDDRRAYDAANSLIAHVNDISQSEHPDDQVAVQAADRLFQHNDRNHAPFNVEQTGIFDWLIAASPKDVVDFVRWNHSRQQAADARLATDLPELIDKAVNGVDRVVDGGLMPHKTKKLVRAAAAKSSFIALDTFEAAQESCDGYYRGGGHMLAMANLYHGGSDGLATPRPDMQRVFTHELGGHAVSAEAGGGLDLILLGGATSVWLDEAWAEHTAQVAEHGKPDALSPRARGDWLGVYMPARELAHLVLRSGEVTIPLELLGEAFVESLYAKQPARHKLNQLLHDSFDGLLELPRIGNNVVGVIGEALARLPASKSHVLLTAWQTHLQGLTGADYCDSGLEWFGHDLPGEGEVITTRDLPPESSKP